MTPEPASLCLGCWQNLHLPVPLRGPLSAPFRLFGVRPSDRLELAGPFPARVAKSLDYRSRKDFLEDYRKRTAWVRALWSRVVPA